MSPPSSFTNWKTMLSFSGEGLNARNLGFNVHLSKWVITLTLTLHHFHTLYIFCVKHILEQLQNLMGNREKKKVSKDNTLFIQYHYTNTIVLSRAIQTHCATLNVDSVNVHLWHKKYIKGTWKHEIVEQKTTFYIVRSIYHYSINHIKTRIAVLKPAFISCEMTIW